MRRLALFLLLAPATLTPGCGLGEGETLSPIGLDDVPLCVEENAISTGTAPRSPAFVRLRARVIETFFVDECHRALLLEPLQIVLGSVHEPVLAIVSQPMDDSTLRDVGFIGTFDLEPDPELPEIYRALATF